VAPGQDYYHRILSNEIFLDRAGERLCMACAFRRGLISLEPRRLREAIIPITTDFDPIPFEVEDRPEDESDDWPYRDR
jgi:hypothetical protein